MTPSKFIYLMYLLVGQIRSPCLLVLNCRKRILQKSKTTCTLWTQFSSCFCHLFQNPYFWQVRFHFLVLYGGGGGRAPLCILPATTYLCTFVPDWNWNPSFQSPALSQRPAFWSQGSRGLPAGNTKMVEFSTAYINEQHVSWFCFMYATFNGFHQFVVVSER